MIGSTACEAKLQAPVASEVLELTSSVFGDSAEFSGTWPKWGMMRNGVSWEVRPSNIQSSVKGYGFWGSITSSMDLELRKFTKQQILKASFGAQKRRITYQMLKHHGLYPTVSLLQSLMGWPQNWTKLEPLATDKFQQWRQQHGRCY